MNAAGPHDTFTAKFDGPMVLSLTDAPAFGYTFYSAKIKADSPTALLALQVSKTEQNSIWTMYPSRPRVRQPRFQEVAFCHSVSSPCYLPLDIFADPDPQVL